MLVFSRLSSFQMYKLEAIQFLVNSTFQFHYTGHKYLILNKELKRNESVSMKYCKFRSFCATFISPIFYFRIINRFLNLLASSHAVYIVNSNSY